MADTLPARPLSDLSAAVRRLRAALLRLAARLHNEPLRFVAEARKLIGDAEPQLAEHIRAGQLVAFFRSAKEIVSAAGLPKRQVDPHGDDHGRIGRTPLALTSASPAAYPSPVLASTVLGADWLHKRIPFERHEFEQLDREAKRVSFTVARTVGENAVRALRDKLAVAVVKGQTLQEFKKEAADALAATALSPAQIETVYRTHVGRAQTAGKMAVLDHPAVKDAFPYLLYTAVHDSRVRKEHKMMEVLGLNETSVYRADDPVWDEFLPPWSWNCRCDVVAIDKETAAEYGVHEAREWVESGFPPAVPTWVEHPPFSPPEGWVPTGRTLSNVKVG